MSKPVDIKIAHINKNENTSKSLDKDKVHEVFQIQDKMSTRGGFLAWLGIMFLAGFTPLPFKVFTITSGVIGFNLTVFFFICLFTRGLRFLLVSYLTYLFGKKFGEFIEKKGALWFTLTGIFIVILAAVLYIAFVK